MRLTKRGVEQRHQGSDKSSSKIVKEKTPTIVDWRAHKKKEGVLGIHTDWLLNIVIDKEIAEIRQQLKTHGSFKKWVSHFGKEKFTESVVSGIRDFLVYEDLYEISLLMKAHLPLPYRLQRSINFWHNRAKYMKVADSYAGCSHARNTIPGAVTLVNDAELLHQCHKALQPLIILVSKLEHEKKLSGGELDYMETLVNRLGHPLQPLAGFFLYSIDNLGLTSCSMASVSPQTSELLWGMFDIYRNQGLGTPQLMRLFDEKTKDCALLKFKTHLIPGIKDGRIPARVRVLLNGNSVVTEQDMDDEEDEPVVKENSVTREGLKKWQKELSKMIVLRTENIEAIKAARELGDISENAEYESAKQEQSFIAGEIERLKGLIRNANVVDNVSGDLVTIGSTVNLINLSLRKKVSYKIVGSSEGDINDGKVSVVSPVGKVLLSKKAGDVVVVEAPKGKYIYKVVSVE